MTAIAVKTIPMKTRHFLDIDGIAAQRVASLWLASLMSTFARNDTRFLGKRVSPKYNNFLILFKLCAGKFPHNHVPGINRLFVSRDLSVLVIDPILPVFVILSAFDAIDGCY